MTSPLDKMAKFNRELAEIANNPVYKRGNIAANRREVTKLSQELNTLGDNGTRGTTIFKLYRNIHGGPALPPRPYAPAGPFGAPAQPALPAEPAVTGQIEMWDGAVQDWHDAWDDFRNYSIRAGARWYHKIGRAFAKTFGYGSRALIGYGTKALYRRAGLAKARRKHRKAEERRNWCTQRITQLQSRIALDTASL